MKQAKVVVLVLVLVGGLYFANQSFMTSFFPRRGVESLGKPEPSANVKRMMEEGMKKKPKADDDKNKGTSKEAHSNVKATTKATEPSTKAANP